jgi:signal transduction histidine kinase
MSNHERENPDGRDADTRIKTDEAGTAALLEQARLKYQLGDFDLAEIQLDYFLEHIKDVYMRAKAFNLKVIINTHLGRYKKSVQVLKDGLQELHLELPLDDDTLTNEVRLLRKRLDDHEPIDHAVVYTNRDQEAIVKLLYAGGMSLHHTSDVLMTWAALQIIHRSGSPVVFAEKAIGYVSYGRMQIIADDIDRGYDLGLKALEVNNSLDDVSLRCRVYGVFAFYIQPWKKAFQASMEFIHKAREAGRISGDFIGSYILNTHQLNLHLLSGLPLQDILNIAFEETHPEIELTYYITHYQMNLIRFLIGESPIFTIPRIQPSWLAARFTIQEEKFYRNHVWARYYLLFGYYELAEQAARHADQNRKLQEGSHMVPANYMIWFLAITQNWCNYTLVRQEELRPVLQHIVAKMTLWREHAVENYDSYWWLLNAELLRIDNQQELALSYYKRAQETAGTNIYHSATVAEYLAKYLLTIDGNRSSALQHLLEAKRLYRQWGAVAKVNQLSQQYGAVLFEKYFAPDVNIEMIQHELSGDLEIESLVKRLMVLFLRISGSTAVAIDSIETNDDFKRLGYCFLLHGPQPDYDDTGLIPGDELVQAYKSQKPVVANRLAARSDVADDPARARGVQSYIILPVTIRDHHTLIIYLENTLASDWYTEEIMTWIRITANQGAVTIENARTHEITLKLNQDIREQMAEKERMAIEIQHQKDLHLHEIVQTQNNERKRIAGDLHDSLGSMLSSVKLRLNTLQEDFVKSNPDKATRFDDTVKLLDNAVQELRRIAHNMLPVSLSRFGLKASLQTFVEQINVAERLDVELQIFGLEHRLREDLETTIYRICQELVQNVIKHAGATTLRIQIIDHEDTINLIVEDNGKGLVVDEVNPGLGFTTIESKVKLFKGTFSIESQVGKGTMVLVDIPKVQ